MADDLFAMVESGKIVIHAERHPLADVAQAHRDLEALRDHRSGILIL
jgi:hypothetical protein